MKYPQFCLDATRHRTFAAVLHLINHSSLVKAGFFFIGGKDSVQCFDCGIILHSWKLTDVPDVEHMKHSPSCSFINRKIRTNQYNNIDMLSVVLESIHHLQCKIDDLVLQTKKEQYCARCIQDEVDGVTSILDIK